MRSYDLLRLLLMLYCVQILKNSTDILKYAEELIEFFERVVQQSSDIILPDFLSFHQDVDMNILHRPKDTEELTEIPVESAEAFINCLCRVFI